MQRYGEMGLSLATPTIGLWVLSVTVLIWAWKVLNWLLLKPKYLEKRLRKEGFQGNSYRLLNGDIKQMTQMRMEAASKPMNVSSDDIAPRVIPFVFQTVKNYGKNSFIWMGPNPRVIIVDPEKIKDILTKNNEFPKPRASPLAKLFATGVAMYDGEKWNKHRKIINPAFNVEKLKLMLSAFYQSSNDMIRKWEALMTPDGSCELDVWPSLQNLTCDVISRTAFGSSYEEGARIFELLRVQAQLLLKVARSVYIPGWRFLPTALNKKMKEIDKDIRTSLKGIINRREMAMKSGEATKDDLLGILLESNHKEIREHGNNKKVGMSIDEVMDECKLFYFAGQETTSVLLVFTMVLLARHPEWQARARDEVLKVFSSQKPDFDGLSHLKVVTMILYEALRLYPAGPVLVRSTQKETKLGNMSLPAGVDIAMPVILVHHNTELWGNDALEFNPERFSEGVSKATKGQVSFFPFGWGPRICIGQNFAMSEAKIVLSMILQRFSFELSPAYTHAPYTLLVLQPQHGAHIILHKL
ncbi:Cytochrome P450 [Quillaja saponaria]|uniref:Cytochrome P450 n=1 Tax=Quillaja saponaria TaxID=32244 RepID=A0AAD7KZU9_QUISA|nr:Cytochrome P450 [Quillaja saponaria]